MARLSLNLKGVTTLLVDSDAFTRGLIATMLRGFGMDSPVIGEVGAQAQHHLENNCADLILIEGSNMPDMRAADLIRWIGKQERSPFRFMPIVAMSDYTQSSLVGDARDAGAIW